MTPLKRILAWKLNDVSDLVLNPEDKNSVNHIIGWGYGRNNDWFNLGVSDTLINDLSKKNELS